MDTVLKDLLPKLRCPDDHSALREASAEEIAKINASIEAGGLKNVGGEAVEEKLDAALVRATGDRAYPIRKDIPILIVEEGIELV